MLRSAGILVGLLAVATEASAQLSFGFAYFGSGSRRGFFLSGPNLSASYSVRRVTHFSGFSVTGTPGTVFTVIDYPPPFFLPVQRTIFIPPAPFAVNPFAGGAPAGAMPALARQDPLANLLQDVAGGLHPDAVDRIAADDDLVPVDRLREELGPRPLVAAVRPVDQGALPPAERLRPNPEVRLAPPPVPMPPPPVKPDPREQALQGIRRGDEDFAAGNYGAALKQYEKIANDTQEPLAFFHMAQAQMALGNHTDAVASIQRGLRLQPDWPLAAFLPRALYRGHPETYQRHLTLLGDAVTRNPKDEALLFLLAYQLWFDGRKDEAQLLFQRAAGLAADPAAAKRFLQIEKPLDVLRVAER
jgi:hypothetical protein